MISLIFKNRPVCFLGLPKSKINFALFQKSRGLFFYLENFRNRFPCFLDFKFMENNFTQNAEENLPKNQDNSPLIHVHQHWKSGARVLGSKCDFFKCDSLVVKVEEDRLIIRKPTLGYLGKTFKISGTGKTKIWRQGYLNDDRVPIGNLYADPDESDEDQLVFYYDSARD